MKTGNFEHQKPIKGIFIGWHDASGALMIKPTSNKTPKKIGTYVLLHKSDWDYIGNVISESAQGMIQANEIMDQNDKEINELKLVNASLLEKIKILDRRIISLLTNTNVG